MTNVMRSVCHYPINYCSNNMDWMRTIAVNVTLITKSLVSVRQSVSQIDIYMYVCTSILHQSII